MAVGILLGASVLDILNGMCMKFMKNNNQSTFLGLRNASGKRRRGRIKFRDISTWRTCSFFSWHRLRDLNRMPPRSKSPASAKRTSPAKTRSKSPKPSAKKAAVQTKPKKTNSDFSKSLRIYFLCVGSLSLAIGLLLSIRPAAPTGGVCDNISVYLLLPPPMGSLSTDSIKTLWACTKAYQEANWWFVLAFFETLYIGIKMLGIPATFTLCILAGALFPMPLCQVVTGFGEAIGSSLCYLLSQAFLRPVVERFFGSKLKIMQKKAYEERDYMLSFNFFLRLTPFMPNWMINLSCPLVGVPLVPFFIGSLFGTQLSLLFLALSGATLKAAGETGFDLELVKTQLKYMAGLMLVLQCVPIAFIWWQKKQKAKAKKASKKK